MLMQKMQKIPSNAMLHINYQLKDLFIYVIHFILFDISSNLVQKKFQL